MAVVGPKKDEPPQPTHLGFRGDPALVQRIDEVAKKMSESLGGIEISRSQVLKLLIVNGLVELEMEHLGHVADKSAEESRDILADRAMKLVELAQKESDETRRRAILGELSKHPSTPTKPKRK